MAATKIADIIEPAVWLPYMFKRTKELSALFTSGIITEDPRIAARSRAAQGGEIVNMPYFKSLTGASEVLSDSVALTVNKITTAQDKASNHFRGKAWGANDLAAALSGADPMEAITNDVANWWARDMQATLISSLKGVFAAASMAANSVSNISIAAGDTATAANKISSTAVIDAFGKLGDAGNDIAAIAMHSTLYWNLVKQDLITFEQFSGQGKPIPLYLGKRVIVDDGLPKVAGATNGFVYSSYLFGAGVIGYGEGMPKVAVETDRDSLLGEDYLINRRHFILHPGGVRWIGNSAGTSPTNAELAIGTNWELVYEQKQVPLIELKTNG